jgi:hypothetical protein
VYNYRPQRGGKESSMFSARSHSDEHLLIRCAGHLSQAFAHSLSAHRVQAIDDRFADELRLSAAIPDPATHSNRGSASAVSRVRRLVARGTECLQTHEIPE